MTKNAFYAQSGGVTAVINASAAGLLAAIQQSHKIGQCFAGKDGLLGALREDLIDTSVESSATIENLLNTPGGAFGSCRYILRSYAEDPAAYHRLIEVFKAHDIGYFFYNGGNGSADTCEKISRISAELGYPIQAIHIPKTIDNDIVGTDCCPGFGSVAKYIATSTLETALDVQSMHSTSTKVYILEVMGRNAGWIAAAAGLAAANEEQAPHIILFPEVAFCQTTFLNAVKRCVQQYGYCYVVASEGVMDEQGQYLSAVAINHADGAAQLGGVAGYLADLVGQYLGYKHHWAVADYLQRAARHLASKTDLAQAFAVGKAAVEAAERGENGVMVNIVRTSNEPYRWHTETIGLAGIAVKERKLPAEYIRPDGYGITEACRAYLLPLIQGEDIGVYSNGLPHYAKLKQQLLPKKLPKFSI